MKTRNLQLFSLMLASAGILSGCGGNDSSSSLNTTAQAPNANALRMFSVEVVNLTDLQPLSPVGVVIHEPGYMGWQEGESASPGLEVLAEGGSPADWLTEAEMDSHVADTNSGSGPILPGQGETVMVSAPQSQQLELTLASMLVHTNDGFSGVSNVLIGELKKNDSLTVYAHSYDAGTEANTETAATIPGPAFKGEGFNSARDDRDFVAIHPGVVTKDDGYGSSDLTEQYRFQNVSAKIVVTRLE